MLSIKWLYFLLVVSSGGAWVLSFRIVLRTEENRYFILETWTLFLMYSQCLSLDLTSPCPLMFSSASSASYLVEEPSAFPFPSQLGLLISGDLAKSYPSQPTDVSFRLGKVRIQVGFSAHWVFSGFPDLFISGTGLFFFPSSVEVKHVHYRNREDL